MTLRTRVPILLSSLLEQGIAVSITPSRFDDEITISWRSDQLSDLVEFENELSGHVHIPFEAGVHGANSIVMEKALASILEGVLERKNIQRSGAV